MNSCESGKFADFNWDDEVVKETCVIQKFKKMKVVILWKILIRL